MHKSFQIDKKKTTNKQKTRRKKQINKNKIFQKYLLKSSRRDKLSSLQSDSSV